MCSFLLFDPNVEKNPVTGKLILDLFEKENFKGFNQNLVLSGYHPLVYHDGGSLRYYGLRKNEASFALCRVKVFEFEELQNFCQKMPWEMGQPTSINELAAGKAVEWKLNETCIVRSFKQDEMTYLYL